MAVTAAMGIFCACKISGKNFEASTTQAAAPSFSLPSGVSITQTNLNSDSGYVFTSSDFVAVENNPSVESNPSYTYYLYVNNAITINYTGTNSSGVTIKYVENGTQYILGTLHSGGRYTFDGVSSEVVTEILLDNHTENSVSFFLVQTPNVYSIVTPFSWKDSTGADITPPNNSRNISGSILLSGLYGTENNPVFIDFYHNGNLFKIVNKNGEFYNQYTGNKLTEEDGTLCFDAAGSYEVFVYDNTAFTGSSYANYKEFSFVIKLKDADGAKNIYIVATTEDGRTLSNGQSLNENVYINFYNLQSETISSVVVEKFHISINGEGSTTTQKLSNPSGLVDQTLVYSDDGYYTIKINLADGYTTADGKTSYTFNFNILTDVHRSYDNGSIHLSNTDYSLVPTSNTIEEITVEEVLQNYYIGFVEVDEDGNESSLSSNNSINYIVRIARPEPAISGVDNGGKYSSGVTATVYGVGNITVTVNKDGSTSTYVLESGSTVNDTADVGSYTITIVDEMGNTITKSFKITQPLNGATIALIVIAVIIAVLFVVIVIKTRNKLKVR